MPIAFDEIPPGILVPLFYAEVKPAQTPLNDPPKILLIGDWIPTGTYKGNGAANNLYILSQSRADKYFGKGSQLAHMYRIASQNAPFASIWGIAMSPAGGAVAAAGSLTVKVVPSRNWVLDFFIAGFQVQCPVLSTDTKATLATRLAAAINKNRLLPVSAAINGTDTATVDLTVKWAGPSGNDVKIELNYYARENDSATALLTAVQPTGGTGVPNLAAALAAIGDRDFDVFVLGHIGNGSGAYPQLPIMTDFLDHVAGRWSPYQQLYGHCVTARTDNFGSLISLATPLNDPHLTIVGATNVPQPSWCWAAAMGALMAKHFSAPPELSRPLQSLEMRGIMSPRRAADMHSLNQRQSLLEAGIATCSVRDDGVVRVDRERTTFKTNEWGDPNTAWSDAGTLFQASYFVRFMRSQITGIYPRAALTTQETGIPGFASPQQIRDTLLHAYKFLQSIGLVENAEIFERALVVERNALDANRVDIMVRPDMVNQLRIVAMVAETHLELDPNNPAIAA